MTEITLRRRDELVRGVFAIVDLWVAHYDHVSGEDRQHLPVKLVCFLVPQD